MTSMMRQRALQKKLAKVNEEVNAGSSGTDTLEGDATEAKPAMSAKALARQRLLKKKQLEAEKKAGNKTEEEAATEASADDTAAAAERVAKAKEETERLRAEEEARRAAEEAEKLRAARQKDAASAMAIVAYKLLNAKVSQLVMQWVDNFGEELALMELEAEELDMEAEAEADLAEEEALDEELLALTSQLAEGGEDADDLSPDQLKEELKVLREKCLKQTQDTKRMKLELRELEEELLVTSEALETAEKKSEENMKLFSNTNRDLAHVQRELLAAKCVPGGGGPSAASETGACGETMQEMEEMLSDANRDLATAQRQVLELKQQLQAAQERGRGASTVSSSGAAAEKELLKLKNSVANTNKELSEAQYTILAKRESFKDLLDMVEELEPHVDTKDRKVKKAMGKIKEKIDEALDEDEED